MANSKRGKRPSSQIGRVQNAVPAGQGVRIQAGPSGKNRAGLRPGNSADGSVVTGPRVPKGKTATGKLNRVWEDCSTDLPTGRGSPEGQKTPARSGSTAGKFGGDSKGGAPGQALKRGTSKVGVETGIPKKIDDDASAPTAESRDSKRDGKLNRFNLYSDARK